MSSRIRATFIDRRNQKVIGDADVIAPSITDPIGAVGALLDSVNPLSGGGLASLNPFAGLLPSAAEKTIAPTFTTMSYGIDLFSFTDTFDFTISLAPDEDFEVRSHDFVEFSIEVNGSRHQIGVGLIEAFVKETTPTQRLLRANGRDLMGQFMNIPFNVQLKREPLTMRRFLDKMIKDSYLEEYMNFRQSSKDKVRDIGSFQPQMQFYSDLEQMRAQVATQYAELAINLIYMNRIGQIEILGRSGTFGSTAPPSTRSPIASLKKGRDVESFRVQQNYTNVLSEFTLFYSSGEAIQDANTQPGSKKVNTDPRVSGHIFQPGYRTFNTTDLVTLGGEVNFQRRIDDVARSLIRKSNRDLNTVVATTTDPFFLLADGSERAFEIGQLFVLESTDREFTSRERPTGTDTIRSILTGIHYGQTPTSLQLQLKFNEVDTLL